MSTDQQTMYATSSSQQPLPDRDSVAIAVGITGGILAYAANDEDLLGAIVTGGFLFFLVGMSGFGVRL